MIYNLLVNNKGQIPKKASEAIRNELLSFATKKITITIEKYVKKRSTQQNRYYWFLIKLISDYTGYNKDEIHDLLASHFIGTKKIKIGNLEKELHKTTTKLSTTDFMGYTEEIKQWAAEKLDLYLPDPDQFEYKE